MPGTRKSHFFLPVLRKDGHCELVSRKGNTLKSFESLRAALARLGRRVVLDGGIVCLDASGKPQFYELFRHRGEPVFYAFDCLYLGRKDLRSRPTIERKRILKDLVGRRIPAGRRTANMPGSAP
jgi:bifunctional non-homologous end joining protein LigD